MNVELRCPVLSTKAPPNHGMQIDAEGYSIPHKRDIDLQFTITHVLGTPEPAASCALLKLMHQSKQAADILPFDKTSACRRCARTVRVQVGAK